MKYLIGIWFGVIAASLGAAIGLAVTVTVNDIALGLSCAAVAISLASLIYSTQPSWRGWLLHIRLSVLRWRAKRHFEELNK
jgi:hypothetical protein